MKKVLMTMVVAAIVGCSSSPYGQGGENACQFVKEQVPGLRDDIAKIEVVAVDTLLSDIGLMFATTRAGNVKLAYYDGKLSYAEMDRVLDSCQVELMHVENSWRYGVTPKDKKHRSQLRKVYTVRVTMKSGDMKEPRILMDEDGVTPRLMEMDFFDKLRKHQITFSH